MTYPSSLFSVVKFSSVAQITALAGLINFISPKQAVFAQIIPDATLGVENSVIIHDVEVRGVIADLIEGGAVRDTNLFHSFTHLNVSEGLRLYFANPVGIENIIGRVTGGDVSQIMGTLGVDGGANLFLSNPQGFVFGEHSQLDVTGSFVATTGSLQFEDGFEFSATDTQPNSPLTISVPLGLQLGANGGEIINRGNLTAGQDLSLIAGDLDLEGQVAAGRDLLLLGERVKIRDRVDAPFIAAAGGDLLVQGNEGVDIFALNHGDSGLFSGGDMVLRSADAVGGDAHYWSGGSFRIETLDGGFGDLHSPYDPIIRSLGDVFINGYQGASLHILAGGKVEIPQFVWITGSDAIHGLKETVSLSNGENLSIDGMSEPTLDIRAGLEAGAIGMPGQTGSGGFALPNFVTTTPTNADIKLGTIFFNNTTLTAPGRGKIFLTNQFLPNQSLEGDIQVNATVTTGDVQGGGSIVVDSRGEIAINGILAASALQSSGNYLGNGGNIKLFAESNLSISSKLISFGQLGGEIDLRSNAAILIKDDISSRNFGPGVNKGQDIDIRGNYISIMEGAFVGTSTTGQVDAGDVFVEANGFLEVVGTSVNGLLPSTLLSQTQNTGNAGSINISTKNLSVRDGARVAASTFDDGDAGNLTIKATEYVEVIGISADGKFQSNIRNGQVVTGGKGKGGILTIETGSLFVRDGAQLGTGTFGVGDGGTFKVEASNSIEVTGIADDGTPSGLFTETNSIGNAGNLELKTTKLNVRDGAIVSSATIGSGNAGYLSIEASEVELSGRGFNGQRSRVFADVKLGATGNGGLLEIKTDRLILKDSGQIGTGTFGLGSGSNLVIKASDSIEISGINGGIFSSSEGAMTGNAGNISITTGDLIVRQQAQVNASTSGQGKGGNLTLFANNKVEIDATNTSSNIATGLLSVTEGTGDAGDIYIFTPYLIAKKDARISTGTRPLSNGQGGHLKIVTNHLSVLNGSQIESGTSGTGNAGNLTIYASDIVELAGTSSTRIATDGQPTASGLFSSTQGSGKGSLVNVNTKNLLLRDGARISALSTETGDSGSININVGMHLNANNGNIFSTSAQSSGGRINITAWDIFLRGDSDITSNVFSGEGGGGNIIINAGSVVVFDDSDILSFAQDGKGGDITLNTPAFFGEGFVPAPFGTDPTTLQGNGRVDVNASGAINGTITQPDVTPVTNNLSELPENPIDTDALLNNSCIVRTEGQQGNFTITGSGNLPVAPGNAATSSYPTGEVQTLPNESTMGQKNDLIREVTGVYQLANGEPVTGRECS